MNNQFATQFLLQEDEFSSFEDTLFDLGADEDLVRAFMKAIRLGLLKPSQAIDIVKSTLGLKEDGAAAAAPAGGGSTTGGGVTNGASFTPGAGEQYAAGTKKVRKKLGENDALSDSVYQELVDDIADKANGNTRAEYDFTIEALKHFKIYNEEQLRGLYKFAVGANYHHIADAVKDVLIRKVSLKEGTFQDDEIAIFDGGEDGLTKIHRKADGSFYGVNDSFDFTAKDEQDLLRKTAMWGYKLISGTVYEDAPRLAGSPAKTNKKGAKNLSAYSSVGFTKAPSATEAGKHIKGVEVRDLWDEDPLYESRAYTQFKKEAATRSKPDQLHQAAKMVQNKLDEIEKLLEFTSQMRNELSEGEANLEYKHNTKKVFEKIHSKVVEVYTKVKGLK